MQKLSEYDFEVQHRKGTEHRNADRFFKTALFFGERKYCERMEVKSNMQQSLNDDVDNVESYNVVRIQENTSSDPDLGITKEVKFGRSRNPSNCSIDGGIRNKTNLGEDFFVQSSCQSLLGSVEIF